MRSIANCSRRRNAPLEAVLRLHSRWTNTVNRQTSIFYALDAFYNFSYINSSLVLKSRYLILPCKVFLKSDRMYSRASSRSFPNADVQVRICISYAHPLFKKRVTEALPFLYEFLL